MVSFYHTPPLLTMGRYDSFATAKIVTIAKNSNHRLSAWPTNNNLPVLRQRVIRDIIFYNM
jgi:hypothetical protein